MLTILSGGVGAAKLIEGFYSLVEKKEIPKDEIKVIVNTGDDCKFYGLYVCPDIDIVIYTLAGIVDPIQRWGIKDDHFETLSSLERFYGKAWFHIGDKDFATHIFRTDMLKHGKTLSEITEQLRKKFKVKIEITPMSDVKSPTLIETQEGEQLDFQEYFVKRKWKDRIKRICFPSQEKGLAQLSVRAEQWLKDSDKIIIAPSNPFLSIDPILYTGKTRAILKRKKEKVIAISPIIKGKALKGPTALLFKDFQLEASVLGYASYYKDIIGTLFIDRKDEEVKEKIEALGIQVKVTNIIMKTKKDKEKLASELYLFND